MAKPHMVTLGAGPAGVGAAFQLTRRDLASVTVLERSGGVGGNAGSFELAGLRVDYGSHRLHPTCAPHVLRDIRALLGDDLVTRPRHGRIRLGGRWIHFPLKPFDLLLRLPPGFAMSVMADFMGKGLRRRPGPSDAQTFASVLEARLGRAICREFYFPYARKIWGVSPGELAVTQARRRVGANSFGKLLRKLLTAFPAFGPRDPGRYFYYPRGGYGQISQAMFRAAEAVGARFEFGATVRSVQREGQVVHAVAYEREGAVRTLAADHIWSTIPVTILVRCLEPKAPDTLLEAAGRIEYRAMILVYVVLEQDRFSEFDAHYFPESDIPISRLSEPKNYSGAGPPDRTVLCAELPCAPSDPEWRMADDALGHLVCAALERAAIPVRAPVKEVITRRLQQAYPIYREGYDAHFGRIDDYLSTFENLLTFGRQGLFAHDNTHHALYMAYAAADCLRADGRFDRDRWQAFRRVFDTHVVED
ncbi:MAG: FAD-dependent oxidoreductase [Candidatus Rokubacteria bacterium]|nr:FAD-dependent oxidoreductase [Candidatus Rokubacteria bacterium]